MKLRYLHSSLVAAILLAAASTVRSSDTPAATPEQKVLDRFLGHWRCSFVRRVEGNPAEYKGTIDFTNSRVLRGQFVQERTELSDNTSGMAMFTYDLQRKCYRSWWFGSTGGTSESTGTWDAASKTLTWSILTEPAITCTVRHHFLGENKFEWELTSKDKTGKVFWHEAGTCVRIGETKK
jgi:hypothetical protein